MARLDIDARMARIDEARGALLIRVVEAVLDAQEMGLAPDQRTLGRSILVRELSLVTA